LVILKSSFIVKVGRPSVLVNQSSEEDSYIELLLTGRLNMKKFFSAAIVIAALYASVVWAVPIHVLTTGDNHGWIMPQTSENYVIGGTSQMMSYWQKHEGYSPKKFLVISTGDNATGPCVSTAFRGDPSIAVMNLMGYDVSAIGNHEFDFTVDKLLEWGKAAKFPFIVSNITNKDGSQVNFALPYVMNTEQGVKIAVVGLTTLELPKTTNNAKPYTVLPYAEALNKTVKIAKDEGAQVVLVAAHVPQDELVKLADDVKNLGIPLMLGGHSHEVAQRQVGETWVINSGSWWDYYTRVDMDYDPKTGKTVVLSSKQVFLSQNKPSTDRIVQREVDKWEKQMNREYGAVVGYTSSGLRIPVLYNMVADAYAAYDTTADFAILNYGSLRQDLPTGQITRCTVLSLMPFNNTLLKIKMTGSQLVDFMTKAGDLGMSGLIKDGANIIVVKTGTAPEADKLYSIIMPNFIYETTEILLSADPNPVKLNDDWRAPVYQWLEKNPTGKDKPLENIIDAKPRS
jgi:5'-nucleotidase / UDP-sugar diphosphatase